MASTRLTARPAFPSFEEFQAPGLRIEARNGLTMASIAARRGKAADLIAAVKASYGVELPTSSRRVVADRTAFLWAGADQWLAIASDDGGSDLEQELGPIVEGLASVADQSDSRAVLSIAGSAARDCLRKGVAIDLHPRQFKTGDVAITHASHIAVMIWQTGEAPSFEIAVPRSYAGSFADWLAHSAAEFARA